MTDLVPVLLHASFSSRGEGLGNLSPAVTSVAHLLKAKFFRRCPRRVGPALLRRGRRSRISLLRRGGGSWNGRCLLCCRSSSRRGRRDRSSRYRSGCSRGGCGHWCLLCLNCWSRSRDMGVRLLRRRLLVWLLDLDRVCLLLLMQMLVMLLRRRLLMGLVRCRLVLL